VVDVEQPAVVADHPVLLFESHGGADRGADGHPDPARVHLVQVDAAVGDGLRVATTANCAAGPSGGSLGA